MYVIQLWTLAGSDTRIWMGEVGQILTCRLCVYIFCLHLRLSSSFGTVTDILMCVSVERVRDTVMVAHLHSTHTKYVYFLPTAFA